MRFFTSDLHLGHARICELAGRPFFSVGEMNAALIGAWNAAVGPDDEVWVLGDMVMGNRDETLRLVGALSGRKILVPGNHDNCWRGRTNREGWAWRYRDAGFERIVYAPTTLSVGTTEVAVDHFPYRGDSREGEERYAEYRPADTGGWLIHGHTHGRWRQSGRMIDVGVDAWGGRPVAEPELAEIIAAGPAERDPLPWEADNRLKGRS